MRRVGVLMAVLAISMILIINPSPYIDSCTIVNEPFTPLFSTAADGDESSESLTSFQSTLDNDVLFYPDTLHNETELIVSSGASGDKATGGVGTISYTYTVNGQVWGNSTTEGVGWVRLNFTAPTGYTIDGWSWGLYAWGQVGDEFSNYSVYNWETDTWDYQGDLNLYGSEDWTNGTTYNSAHWQDNECAIIAESEDLDSAQVGMVYVDCGVVEFYYMTLADSDHYAESFADVSDCLIMDDEGDDTFSSDGDLLHFESKTDSENDGESVYSNVPSLVGQYLEIRYRLNTTSLAIFAVGTYSSDGGLAGNINWFVMTITTSWTTSKFPINSDTVIESVRLYIYHVTGQPPVDLQVDYLRIGPADEMGWQHDGSTTAGVTNSGQGEVDFTTSSDGDKLTLQALRTSGSGSLGVFFYIAFDTTATSIDIERDYYPFFELSYSATLQGGCTYINTRFCLDGKYSSNMPVIDEDGNEHVGYVNTQPFTATTGNKWFGIYSDLNAEGKGFTFVMDYVKAYSIANDTVTHSGVGTDDYLYVDSGVLYSSIDDGYIEMNHDPALSVSDTYSVYNLTTPSTAPEFSQYVSEWSAYSDETRGATTSGTVTDIKLKFTADGDISAIKFIEDGTAPIIVRSSANPPEPDDDEGVVLKAVVDDGVEVYSVKFNAIVYPTGFSDVDYDATEQSDNLWMYSFSSLDAGNYTFKVIASDGANENALTEYAYIDFVVREAVIVVEEITLIGAGEDFSMMTFSARINRDCSFTIYEESVSSAESDTHTGSVTAPSFNLAWTKLDVDDSNVNFTIKFTSGSLTYNYTSQYQVAQTTFYVSTVTQMVSLDTVTVTGRITKLGAYQVYDDLDVLKDYGSITDLDFKIQFTRWGGYDEQNHDFAIKFTNGSQTCWYNSSFYAFKKPVVAPFQTTDPNALYAFQVSFWTLIAVVAIGGMVAVDIYRKEVK